ncbi:hypothetical protein CRV24_008476 [Beauveria bassiana]|nr:hypothetical protein CRV24_008476 [Beauveria bassiana]
MVSAQLSNATFLPLASLAVLFSATSVEADLCSGSTSQSLGVVGLPAQAQAIDSAKFASVASVPPPSEYNGTTIWVPPGTTRQGLKDRPFLVYDPDFLEIIGHEPKLVRIAESEQDPLFHEAVVWTPETDEVFFAQSAGNPAAGTGLNKSAIVQKISVAEALQIASGNKTGPIKIETITSNPPVINPNGIAFSPDGKYVYVTDTGAYHGNFGYDWARPATIYRFDVTPDGTFENRMTFAFADLGVPDGIHCDSKGNVYAACGDGVHVWNPSGKLLGNIFVDDIAGNFQFIGDGRMVICAETRLYLALVAAKPAPIH